MPCARITRATRLRLTRGPGGAAAVDPVTGWDAVVELGGRPRRPDGVVLGMDGPQPLGQLGVGCRASRPGRRSVLPRVDRRALDLDERTQPLHLEGVLVVGDELEAAHQFVSPAKYLAAWRRISRSVLSLVVSASSSLTRACSRTIACSGVSSRALPVEGSGGCWGLSGLRVTLPPAAVFLPVPNRSSQWRSVPRSIPRSLAMPRTVAPGVDSYKSTACRRNSSEQFLRAMVLGSSRFPSRCWIQRVQ